MSDPGASDTKSSRAPNSLPPSVPTSSVISRIERELRELWDRSAAPSGTNLLAPPTARACTMNLVVVAGSSDLADRYTRVVDEVAAAIPSRAIIVALEADTVESALSGNVVKIGPPDEPYVGSERVRLTASGQVVDRVASAVEALCVPEVPTTLVWLGRVHVDDPVFRSLAGEVQRVILDTDYTSLTSLVALAKVTAERESAELADLAWTRLATWQELCARFFDAPQLIAAAHGVTDLTVTQAAEPGARLGSEAALLIGWLATRLEWSSGRMGGQLRFKRKDGGDVRVKLGSVPQPEGVAPAALAGVRIAAKAGDVSMVGTIDRDLASGPATENGAARSTRDADMLSWKIQVQGGVTLEQQQQVRLGANKGSKLLERTLHRAPSDATLLEAIAFAERVFDDGITTG